MNEDLNATYRAGKASEKELFLFFSDSVFMPSFHNQKEGTKTLTENSTALLQRKTP